MSDSDCGDVRRGDGGDMVIAGVVVCLLVVSSRLTRRLWLVFPVLGMICDSQSVPLTNGTGRVVCVYAGAMGGWQDNSLYPKETEWKARKGKKNGKEGKEGKLGSRGGFVDFMPYKG